MAVTELFTGSATITNTEYSLPNASTTLTPRTDDFLGEVWIDVAAVTIADNFVITVKEKATSAGTQRVVWRTDAGGTEELIVIPALTLIHGWDVTMQRTAGSSRAISWSFRSVL